MRQKNKHGLSRHVPDGVARRIRQECGFGCVLCGNALYQYHHVDPPFEKARSHDPDAIALLCAGCHDAVTRGMRSNDSVSRARRDPFCMRHDESRFQFDLSQPKLTVEFAGITFVNTPTVIQINDQPILVVEPPETVGAPPQLSARFYDRTSTLVARIDRNEWSGLTAAFDIEAKGRTWTVRSAARNLDLVLRLEPPNGISVERLNLHHGGCSITSTPDGGFRAETGAASLECRPKMVERVERAPSGIILDDTGVRLGTDCPLMFKAPGVVVGPSSLHVAGGPVRFVEASDIDPDERHPVGKRFLQFDGNATVKLNVSLPQGLPGVPPSPAKFSRNDPCPCGSGKKHKKCCGRG